MQDMSLRVAGRDYSRTPVILILAVLATLAVPTKADAQIPRPGAVQDTAAARRAVEQRLGRPVSQGEIVERLRQSGLSRSEIRARLQAAGYDPGLADSYFDAIERGSAPTGEPSAEFIDALAGIGLAGRGGASLREDSLARHEFGREPLDSLMLADSVARAEGRTVMEVFGLRTFRRAGTQFEPMRQGPVDPSYRLGPGDELQLVLTGDVEAAYALDVSRQGFIFIPDVGQVSVNGITLGQLEDALYSRLGRVYSGVSRSPNASTRFQVSLGALRTNQVMVTGDVVRPGSYQVSSVAGLFNALYQAGGPTEEGSFRSVEIHRGGRVAHVADLYDFLVRGDGGSDIRLEQNDRIFVPPAGAWARVEGHVRRPAIYELRPGEGLPELLTFAGGLRSDALVRRIQVDRIVPPAERQPGYYRTLVDIDLGRLAAGAAPVPLMDGDIVHVFGVSDLRRNRIFVEGEVRNPGMYEWTPGSTLWSMLERADGLAEHAYTARAHVYRLDERDGVRRLIPTTLERDASGAPLVDLPLADNDSIVVLSRIELRTAEFVSINGFVKHPDTYNLARGMTLKDLILAAGGFEHGASAVEAELSRQTDPGLRTDTTAYVFRIRLSPVAGGVDGNNAPGNSGDVLPNWMPAADDVELVHGDRVFIRRAPGHEPAREVRISGQVGSPGRYVLTTRDERLSDILARAGGLTPQAYAGGMHVVRRGRIVAADLQRALSDPRDHNNIVLAEGDSIHVPAHDPMVVVSGAVNFESRVLFVPGKSAGYYVDQAGGLVRNADRRRATITYANGQRATLWSSRFLRRSPGVEPGSQIFVPAKDEDAGTNWDLILTRSVGIMSALATMAIAVSQLR
jgi:polysaccharide biosynthesis/export protein